MVDPGSGNDQFYGTVLLRTPGVREYVRVYSYPAENSESGPVERRRLQYLGADDEWHDAEGSPLSMTDVIAARDRSMIERRARYVVESRELSIEDARKVARLVRQCTPDAWPRHFVALGIAQYLREQWPHLDWEVRGGEIIPFERPPSEAVDAHAKSVNARYAGLVEATTSDSGIVPEASETEVDDGNGYQSPAFPTLEAAIDDAKNRREREIIRRFNAASEVIIDGVRVKSPDIRIE